MTMSTPPAPPSAPLAATRGTLQEHLDTAGPFTEDRPLRFRYTNHRGITSDRRIVPDRTDPIHLFRFPEGFRHADDTGEREHWSISGRDLDRGGARRTFRIGYICEIL